MREDRPIRMVVNGSPWEGSMPDRKLLLDFIRDDLHLTGTHVGCEHGCCGACTVLLNGKTVRSCLMLAVQANQCEIMTVEGLARGGRLHPLQLAFSEAHALQCGYCTPGFLMTAYELLESSKGLSDHEIREGLAGNLCRCTGYQNIVEAVKRADQTWERVCR